MDLHLRGKTALITGASKGIGLAIARALAAEGCHLHLTARSAPLLQQIQVDLQGKHDIKVDVHALDLSLSESASLLFERCRDIDILVNNAGAIPNGSLEQIDEATWRRAWDLKVFGYINMTRSFLAGMRKRRRGVVINIIGMAAEKMNPEYVAGTTGNAALMAFTRAVGSTSLDDGVRVVGINPGTIETERLIMRFRMQADREFGDSERWPEMRLRLPQIGEPEHIADLAAFLASDRAAYITGVVYAVDGGMTARSIPA
jgi:NAD(P)-dependent dehydrogenase (short-subunit alcohol dehydrogenase family)